MADEKTTNLDEQLDNVVTGTVESEAQDIHKIPNHQVVVTGQPGQTLARRKNPLYYISTIRLRKYAKNIGVRTRAGANHRALVTAIEKKWKTWDVVFPGTSDNVKIARETDIPAKLTGKKATKKTTKKG